MTRGLAEFLNFVGYILTPFGLMLYGAGWRFPGKLHSIEFIVVIVVPALIWGLFWSCVIDKRYLDKYLSHK